MINVYNAAVILRRHNQCLPKWYRLRRDASCDGRLVQLYRRESSPQRWVPAGLYCSKCHAFDHRGRTTSAEDG